MKGVVEEKTYLSDVAAFCTIINTLNGILKDKDEKLKELEERVKALQTRMADLEQAEDQAATGIMSTHEEKEQEEKHVCFIRGCKQCV